MSRLALVALLALLAQAGAVSQSGDTALEGQLKRLFPEAASFSQKMGSPAHYEAYGPAPSGQTGELLGLAWWTTEVEPLERGYDGPIKMLVGMDKAGVLTGVVLADHREPYGYFSIELPEFVEQFEKKSIRDSFKPGQDVDAVSRATITVTSASRAIRNSGRKIARAYLTPPAPAQAQ